ncbi:P-loop NTPase fold protein [Roseateles sp. BYS180W]|uniref:P-loop NTPase fold protein n=1 Tax=Roseateles rivi TaxID=3299028 RepID=A0ABW7FT38_9BURK
MSEGPQAYTLALDAEWGAGKTFFLECWQQDLKGPQGKKQACAVVNFNAWAADFAADPMPAFQSELRAALSEALNTAGITAQAKSAGLSAIRAASEQLGRVALSMTKFLGNVVLKQATGFSVGGWAEVISGVPWLGPYIARYFNGKTVGDVLPTKSAEDALDTLFTVQLDEHVQRQKAIVEFKRQLAEVIKALSPSNQAFTPLFVFVDELDRCKPSFAVGLLEAIKHVFNVPGMCVVVATHMDQLAYTVSGVYGAGFDGRTYLQRFFDSVVALPPATGPQKLAAWLEERPILKEDRCCWVQPPLGYQSDDYGSGAAGMLAWVFDGIPHDLRSQLQVLDLMEAAASGFKSPARIHAVWLAILCSLWHSKRDAFKLLEKTCRRTGDANSWVEKAGLVDATRTLNVPQVPVQPFPADVIGLVSLRELAEVYVALCRGTKPIALAQASGSGKRILADTVSQSMEVAKPGMLNSSIEAEQAQLISYFDLVRNAGHLWSASANGTA